MTSTIQGAEALFFLGTKSQEAVTEQYLARQTEVNRQINQISKAVENVTILS